MNLKRFFLSCTILFASNFLFAQNSLHKYIVYYKTKDVSTFNPYVFFDVKAIERRLINGINLYDYSDVPVNENFCYSVKKEVTTYRITSRWLNASVVIANEQQIQKLQNFNFIASIQKLENSFEPALCSAKEEPSKKILSTKDIDLLHLQINRMQGKMFAKNNITGKGIRIAVFDAGFPGVDKIEAFKQVRDNNRIIDYYDFVKNKKNVFDYNEHGTNTLSCIAGVSQQGTIGLATDAEFLLARTENAKTEPFSEEENWLAAAEWADKNGAQIISSSLGYTANRYFQKDMDGHTSLVAKAARMAVRKGILVVNSAGNDGDEKWHIMGTPADVDSVLSVGGIHPKTNIHTSFSSYGPIKGSLVKPNVTALAHVIVAGPNGLHQSQGTSFSCPLVSGFAACVLQKNPTLKTMELFDIIEKSSDLFPYFDYAHGYGVPQATYFFENDSVKITLPQIKIDESNFKISVFIDSTEVIKLNNSNNKLFYHIQNANGSLHRYSVIKVTTTKPIEFKSSDFEKGQKLVIFFNDYLYTKQF